MPMALHVKSRREAAPNLFSAFLGLNAKVSCFCTTFKSLDVQWLSGWDVGGFRGRNILDHVQFSEASCTPQDSPYAVGEAYEFFADAGGAWNIQFSSDLSS